MSETLKNITLSSEAILDKNLQKFIEGSGFWVQVIKQQMLLDPKYPTCNRLLSGQNKKMCQKFKTTKGHRKECIFDGQALLDDFSQQK